MRKMKNDAPTVADQSASSMITNVSSSNTIAQTSLQNQGSSNKDNIENILIKIILKTLLVCVQKPIAVLKVFDCMNCQMMKKRFVMRLEVSC